MGTLGPHERVEGVQGRGLAAEGGGVEGVKRALGAAHRAADIGRFSG